MKKSYYITTPIYYVNAAPHLGTSYTSVLGDVQARYRRSMGQDVLFLTGVDEHGEKVAQAAAEHNMQPQAWCDLLKDRFIEMGDLLHISNDDFIRTTEPRHIHAVQHFWDVLKEQGYIYKGDYSGWYCVPEETFFTETQVRHAQESAHANGLQEVGSDVKTETGSPLCPDCGRPLERVSEQSWFFKLSAFEDALLAYYEAHPHFIEPETRRNEVISFVKEGLKDLSVSRSTFNWGIELPFDTSHVTYVWFDALINYLTAAGYGADNDEFAYRWPAQVHLVGKDIIRFHCVIWPAMLMAAGIEPPQEIFAHGFLTVKNDESGAGEKMSKSKGNVISPDQVIDLLGVDGYRYYFMSDVAPGSDGAISFERMRQVYNADLANSWGNLVSRTISMSMKYFEGMTPSFGENKQNEDAAWALRDNPLKTMAKSLIDPYCKSMESFAYDKALAKVMDLVHRANSYIEESEPWTLAKDAQTHAELVNVIADLLETIRICAYLLMPVMPMSSQEVLRRLSIKNIPDTAHPANNIPTLVELMQWGQLSFGAPLIKGEALFPRLEHP